MIVMVRLVNFRVVFLMHHSQEFLNNAHYFQILISQKGMEYTHATSLWVVVDQEFTHLR